MNNEKGFASSVAIITIFSLSVVLFSIALYEESITKKIKAYKNKLEAKKEAEEIIIKILDDFQILRSLENGAAESQAILEIANKYAQYNFIAKDVSTGINQKFLSKEILESNAFKRYINSSEIQVSEYGWINLKLAEQKLIESVKKDLKSESAFPIINTFPIYNIYEMNKGLIKAVLEYEKIPEIEEKLKKIEEQRFYGLDRKSLRKILKVQENHAVFNFIGTKTTFWKVRFETKQYKVKAIYALVPDEKENLKVEKYIIVEKELSMKEKTK